MSKISKEKEEYLIIIFDNYIYNFYIFFQFMYKVYINNV